MICGFFTFVHDGCGKMEEDPHGEHCGCKVIKEVCQNEGTEPAPLGSYSYEMGEKICAMHAASCKAAEDSEMRMRLN